VNKKEFIRHKPFDEVDALQMQNYSENAIKDMAKSIYNSGIVAGLNVSYAGSGMNITINIGSAYDEDFNFINVETIQNAALNTGHATNPRYDLISIKHITNTTNNIDTANKYGRGTSFIYSNNISDSFEIVVTQGTAAAIPTIPSTPTDCINLAVIKVIALATIITNNDIIDKRENVEFKLYPNEDPIPTTITLGTKIYNITNYSIFDKIEMNGRTLVNILGRHGNCENTTTSMFLTTNGTRTLDSANKVYGDNGYKLTIGSLTWMQMYWNNIQVKPNAYLVCAEIKKGTTSTAARVYTRSTGVSSYGNTITNTSNFEISYTTINIATSIDVLIDLNGASGEYAFVDGIRLYEITSTEKAYIDSLSIANAQAYIAKKYPYVDSIQSIFNPYMISEGKNLFNVREYVMGTLGNFSLDIDGYLVSDNYGGAYYSHPRYKLAPNTSYTISLVRKTGTDNFNIEVYDLLGVLKVVSGYLVANNYTFTTGSDSEYYVKVFSGNGGKLKDIMLNVGSTALPFTEQNRTYQFIQETFRSNLDGTIADRLYQGDNDEYRKIQWFEELKLDGSLTWAFNADNTGFKQVSCTDARFKLVNITGELPNVVKYNGDIANKYSTAGDGAYVNKTTGTLFLNVPDTDTGWGESISPTVGEINAYLNGYRMYSDAGTNVPWNGTGVKHFGAINPDNSVAFIQDNVPPTTINNLIPRNRVQYQLAQFVDVSVEKEGTVEVFEGLNQITLGAGVIVREEVVDMGIYTADNSRHINFDSTDPNIDSKLAYRADKILSIYKNGVYDNWSHVTSGQEYGRDRVAMVFANFDLTASYSATYYALDMYKLGIAPQSLVAQYDGNLAEVVQSNVSDIVDAKTQISIIRNEYAKKQQGQWIAPTLLNGWVNITTLPDYAPIGYRKDEFGNVTIRGLIQNGTVGSIIFYLPLGYRPSKQVSLACIGNGSLAYIRVFPDGSVKLESGATGGLALDFSIYTS
jgi:hypothetical protein